MYQLCTNKEIYLPYFVLVILFSMLIACLAHIDLCWKLFVEDFFCFAGGGLGRARIKRVLKISFVKFGTVKVSHNHI